jgi:hypothetical protein
MAFSHADIARPEAASVAVDDTTLSVDLADGRTIAVPLAWYPRLLHASPAERGNWRLIAGGEGEDMYWPDLDEDISLAALLGSRRSTESVASRRFRTSWRGGEAGNDRGHSMCGDETALRGASAYQ